MKQNRRTPHGGWYHQPDRHALASKGVQTTNQTTKSYALSSKIPTCGDGAMKRIDRHIGNIYQNNLLKQNSLESYRELITIKKIIDKNNIDIQTDELDDIINHLDKKLDGEHEKSLNLEKKFEKFLERWKNHQKDN